MIGITSQQIAVLNFVCEYLAVHGYPPTRSEIARRLNFASDNTAQEHLKALARKGYIKITPHISRGIRVNEAIRRPA